MAHNGGSHWSQKGRSEGWSRARHETAHEIAKSEACQDSHCCHRREYRVDRRKSKSYKHTAERLPSVDKSTHAWTGAEISRMLRFSSQAYVNGFRPAALPAQKFPSRQVPEVCREKMFASARGRMAKRRSGATVSEDNKVQKQMGLYKPCVPLSTEGIIGQS